MAGPNPSRTSIDAVVFDLGGVLIDWNPRHLYRKLFPNDEAAMEDFLAAVTTPEWNARQDAGRARLGGHRLPSVAAFSSKRTRARFPFLSRTPALLPILFTGANGSDT